MSEYHPLPLTGKITILDIHREKGHTTAPSGAFNVGHIYSLEELGKADDVGGDGVALNPNNPADMIALIHKTAPYTDTTVYPYALSDWYGYNQLKEATDIDDYETDYISSSNADMYRLTRSEHDYTLAIAGHAWEFGGRRPCVGQEAVYNVAHQNDKSVDPDDPIAASPSCFVRAYTKTWQHNSTYARTEATVDRGVLRLDVSGLKKVIYDVDYSQYITHTKIYLTGTNGKDSGGYSMTGLSVVLVTYYPENNSSIYDWKGGEKEISYGSYSITYRGGVLASDVVPFVYGSTMTFTLNSFGTQHIQRHVDSNIASCHFLVCMYNYDFIPDINYAWWDKPYFNRGTNLVSNADSHMTSACHWVVYDGTTSGSNHSVTLTKASTDYSRPHSLKLISYFNDSLEAGRTAAYLHSAYISQWPTYTDPEGTTVAHYSIYFDYIGDALTYEEDDYPSPVNIYRSHCHFNSEHLKCEDGLVYYYGIFPRNPVNYPPTWRSSEPWSEDVPAPGYVIPTDNGLSFFNAYRLKNREGEISLLYIDNLRLYKTFFTYDYYGGLQINSGTFVHVTYGINNSVPVITTVPISSISSSSAYSGGSNASNRGSWFKEYGLVWSTSPDPTVSSYTGKYQVFVDSLTVDDFSRVMSPLSSGTTYYVRAYAINHATVNSGVGYGGNVEFTTVSTNAPTVTTTDASSITSSSAVLGGNVTAAGGGTVTERGIVWMAGIGTPRIGGDGCTKDSNGSGTGVFSENISLPYTNTWYSVAAYAQNVYGVSYGETDVFATLGDYPNVITSSASSITYNSAVLGGNVTDQGGSSVTDRGIVYSRTNPSPTIGGDDCTKDQNGTGTGVFSETIGSLLTATTYYFKAYAINSTGTSYGELKVFYTISPT